MREEISCFYSGDDTDRKAVVYMISKDKYEVDFFDGPVIVATESYDTKSLNYHEDAAENFVIGVKNF